jgi:phosphoribosyl-ATP pyrophosphohydrolase
MPDSPSDALTLNALSKRIAERAKASPQESYTAKLLEKGPEYIARKFGEEAVETIIAACSEKREPLIAEAADVVYHLLVLLQARQITIEEVMAELQRRTHQSGIAEKAARIE